MSGHLAECKTLVTQDEGDCDCLSLHRTAVIEECARVADDCLAYAEECNQDTAVDRTLIHAYRKVATAIRALKDKP